MDHCARGTQRGTYLKAVTFADDRSSVPVLFCPVYEHAPEGARRQGMGEIVATGLRGVRCRDGLPQERVLADHLRVNVVKTTTC